MYLDTTYTNGVIAVKEKSLLKDKIFRLCEVSVDEAFRMLLESGFGGAVTDNVYEYEKLLTAETASLDEFIRIYAPSQAMQAYFLLPRDFHNAKAFVKAKCLGESADKMLAPSGMFSVEDIQLCVMENAYAKVDAVPELVKACKESTMLLETDVNGADIGSIFEKCLYEALVRVVKKNRALRELLSAKIDMTNVLTALRSGDENVAETQYLSGGKLSKKRVLALCTGDLEKMRLQFGEEWKEFISLCLDAKEKGVPFTQAEKYRDGHDVISLEKRKFELVKGEPFLYYVYSKKADIANVRIVLACLMAGLDEMQIKNRLRK
ncbi:MAG: V-type ATPase subunit [Clostridia bacterium]|nr:V-type ATPase subunit [Clostridia bacterium]